jgi:signal transduction histidine kinase
MNRAKRILVIEDAFTLRKDIIEMLTFEGFDVHGAENGQLGIERARELNPDLIICDIMMPVLDGFGVLHALQKDAALATTPFIFLTARTDRMDVRQGMELGADDFLTKPFTAAELIRTVHARLQKVAAFEDESTRAMDNLRGNIIMALPHELRTPLHVILGFSELLMNDSDFIDAERVNDMARHINRAGSRLYHLIENFIIYAQTEIALNDPKERVAMGEGTTLYPKTAIETYATAKAEQGQRNQSRRDDLFMHVVDVEAVGISEDFLKKLVEEIVDNAFKFSSPGSQVHVRTLIEGPWYVLQVTDNGRGMKQEHIDAIGAVMQFERRVFEQQGAGLGLVVCRRLAQLNGGDLTIESELERGTRVTVHLPMQRAAREEKAESARRYSFDTGQ